MNQPSTPSGDLAVAAATVVTARPARLMTVTLTPAAAACSVIVYDNASAASGTVLARIAQAANAATISLPLEGGIVANAGLTVAVAGAGAIANLSFIPE